MMPRLFGGDVAARLRSDIQFRSVPILFLSGAVRRDRVAELNGVVAGFPLVAKPVTAESLISHIERQLVQPPAMFGPEAALPARMPASNFQPEHEQSP
jgi:CheY-like chemotaxis protein